MDVGQSLRVKDEVPVAGIVVCEVQIVVEDHALNDQQVMGLVRRER